MLFGKPAPFRYKAPYITFAKFENLEKFYEKAAVTNPFQKSIAYSWGHADIEKPEIVGTGKYAAIAREAGLYIMTDNLSALDDIVSITAEAR